MEEAATRAKAWMTNKEVMSLARRGETFRPAEGRSGTGGEDLYSLSGDGGTWVAVFNFDAENGKSRTIDLSRVNIDGSKGLTVRDLWSGESFSLKPGTAEHLLELEPAESKSLFYI